MTCLAERYDAHWHNALEIGVMYFLCHFYCLVSVLQFIKSFDFDVLTLISFFQSIFNMISREDQKNLPDDENTPEKRTDKIWDFFGKRENGRTAF